MQDRFLKLVLWVLVTLALALTSCGGWEGASPTSPLLVAGDNHTVAIKKDGTLWAWGSERLQPARKRDKHGQLYANPDRKVTYSCSIWSALFDPLIGKPGGDVHIDSMAA
jgi:hypothetical protein